VQVRQFREKYGVIKNVSDREFFTNSFHNHVSEDITPFEKQSTEKLFWDLFDGGKIQYTRYKVKYNHEAIKSVVKRGMSMGFYQGVNIAQSFCNDCGERASDIVVCPSCGSSNITKIDRACGYLGYSRVKGETRFNEAKQCEIDERKSM
jgi:ribonucleoside-triphosphate reductase